MDKVGGEGGMLGSGGWERSSESGMEMEEWGRG